MSSGRYMAYSPSPSAPHSPHIPGIRSATNALFEQENPQQGMVGLDLKVLVLLSRKQLEWIFQWTSIRCTTLLGASLALEGTLLREWKQLLTVVFSLEVEVASKILLGYITYPSAYMPKQPDIIILSKEAELPVEMIDARLMQACDILKELIKPVDEAQDFFKKQQLRELAMLNGTLHEEDSHMSGSLSPFP